MSFKPIVATTSNISKTISDLAGKFKTTPEHINFSLIAFTSYYRKAPSIKWVAIDEKRKKQLSQIQHLTHPDIFFKEYYKIKLFPKVLNPQCRPIMQLKSNSSKSKVQLVIRKESKFALTKACLQEYIEETKRQMLRSNYMLGMFCINIESALSPMVAHFKKHKSFTSDIKIIISSAVEPETNSSSQFIAHYLNKAEDQRTAYEQGVDPEELVYEYKLPVASRGGRNCQGLYLQPHGPEIISNEMIYYDDTIRMEVNEKSLKYYALKTGYIDLHDQKLIVSNTLSLDGAAFNTTGSITVGGHREIDVKITSKNVNEDAIDKGVAIDVSNIDVAGSVAGNTLLKAESIKIGAQTHKASKIVAQEDASVYLHRGDLKAKDVEIAKLEHGLVEADTVKVKEVLGGEIRARKVEAEILHSNARIYASESIKIEKIKGANNRLIIAPDKIANQEEVLAALEEKVEALRKELQKEEKDYAIRVKQFEHNYVRIDEFKKQIAKAVQVGKPAPKAASIRFKKYTLDKQRLESLDIGLSERKKEIEDTLLELDRNKNIMLFAKIHYDGNWDGHQEIYYEHSGSDNIEKYTPEGSIPEIVYTKIDSEDLVAVSGFND